MDRTPELRAGDSCSASLSDAACRPQSADPGKVPEPRSRHSGRSSLAPHSIHPRQRKSSLSHPNHSLSNRISRQSSVLFHEPRTYVTQEAAVPAAALHILPMGRITVIAPGTHSTCDVEKNLLPSLPHTSLRLPMFADMSLPGTQSPQQLWWDTNKRAWSVLSR